MRFVCLLAEKKPISDRGEVTRRKVCRLAGGGDLQILTCFDYL